MQFRFERHMKNKTLMTLSLAYVVSFIAISCIGLANIFVSTFLIILIMFNQYIIEGAYSISAQKYVTNFTSQKVRGKMVSILYFLQGLGTTVLLAIATLVLDRTNAIYLSYIVIGIMMAVVFTIILMYMKKRFGLAPEQYTKEDLRYDE